MKNIVVVGLGNISKRHRQNVKKLYPKAKVFALSAHGRAITEPVENADATLPNIEAAIAASPDLAIIASPATHHAQHAMAFIQAGIPVLVEKPITANYFEAVELCEAADKHQAKAAVGYCLRYLSSAQVLKNLLEQNAIGDIHSVMAQVGQYLPQWRPGQDFRQTVSAQKRLGGGALLELSHELDYLQWFFGILTPISAILQSSKELSLDVEDCVDILAKAKNAAVYVHLDFLQREPYRTCRIIGSRGTLEWNVIQNKVVLINDSGVHEVAVASQEKGQNYLDMLKDFEGMIAGKPHACVTLEEASKTIKFIEQVKKNSSKDCLE